MFCKVLCEDCGMFFKFFSLKFVGMWMKNIFVFLDVVFIDRKGVIMDIKFFILYSLELVGLLKEVFYVLEMN